MTETDISITLPKLKIELDEFLDLYRQFDTIANFMALDVIKKESDERHDREECDGIYYPYIEDYQMSPTLVCLLCMRQVDE